MIVLPFSKKAIKTYEKKLIAAMQEMFMIIHLSACYAQADDRENLTPDAFDCEMGHAREKIMDAALNDVPSRLDKNGKEQKREAFNMAQRFREKFKAYFAFITTPGMGPTNNIAEQAVRFVVIDPRITQGARSKMGRKTIERLWSVVGTCALQGYSAFEFIFTAVHAHFCG